MHRDGRHTLLPPAGGESSGRTAQAVAAQLAATDCEQDELGVYGSATRQMTPRIPAEVLLPRPAAAARGIPPLGASACRHSCGPAITTTDTGGMLGNQFPHVPPEPRPATTLGEPQQETPDLYAPPQIDLSANDQARLDLAYELLIELGLRRRARLTKAALQGEEEVG
jgi:hypothetical protein